ncbi:MAG: enoyl-CoA hydratase/isomerase family protein [Pseudomonadota bacterium]|nr:enoyl-CoA hydratase/isomerase family protein [Pseudomonadota bacterium]
MSEVTVKERREGPIVWVELHRPDARNALNLAMCRALREKFEALDADPEVRVVILCGAGPSFCAGADLKERRGRDESWVIARRQAAYAAYEAISRCRKPVAAAVHGAVVGSGGEMAMSCDFIVAEAGAAFRFPEPQWGTVGATQRLQRIIGVTRAKELLFTGRAMPAEEAYQLGLVARIAPVAGLQSTATEIAAAIAKAPPLAMALTKEAVNLGSEVALAAGLLIEQAAVERCLRDSDWRKGVEQFAQVVGHAKHP